MKKLFLAFLFCLCPFTPLQAQTAEPRYLAVLVEFKDVHFSLENPAIQVEGMLNQEGFHSDGATGSVRDYYRDNSRGLYQPSFDVAGPVRLSRKEYEYGRDVVEQGERRGDKAPEKALYEACTLLDDSVDFSRYDADGDGLVDLVIMVFAGYDQSASGEPDALWSHQWNIQRYDNREVSEALFDGVRLGQYIAAPELRGGSGRQLASIGFICHELGHFLGLPDFYDTDFHEGGYAGGLYQFSLMGSGLYNNDGHTPPSLNALEMSMLGWLNADALQPLPSGSVRMESFLQGGVAYRSETSAEGECFLYEYRDGQGWDAPLPTGLLVYHLDQSDRSIWENWREENLINARAGHPCFYLIPAFHPALLEYDATLLPGQLVFPGLSKMLYYEPVDWKGQFTGVQITAIRPEQGGICFEVLRDAGANINGRVTDGEGRPLEGVTLSLSEVEGARAQSRTDGYFRLDIPEDCSGYKFTLSASKSSYRTVSQEVSLRENRMVSVALALPGENDPAETRLTPYDESAQMGYFTRPSILGGVKFPAKELYPYVGERLSEVCFYPRIQPAFDGEVYVVVDIGGRRVLSRKVEQLNKGFYIENCVDISDAGIVIPEGEDIHIGYGALSDDALFYVGTVYPVQRGRSFYSPFSLESSDWQDMYVPNAKLYMDVMLSALVAEKTDASSLADLGYACIDPGTGRYREGEEFPLRVIAPEGVTSVSWSMDGEAVAGESVVLQQGQHSLKARLNYADGREEILELLLKVN